MRYFANRYRNHIDGAPQSKDTQALAPSSDKKNEKQETIHPTRRGFNPADVEHVDAVVRAVAHDVGPGGVKNETGVTCNGQNSSRVRNAAQFLHKPVQKNKKNTVLTQTHACAGAGVRVRLQGGGVVAARAVALPQVPQLYDSGTVREDKGPFKSSSVIMIRFYEMSIL